MTLNEIIKLEEDGCFFQSFEEWKILHSNHPDNLDIYLHLLFNTWYNLTYLINNPEEHENVLREALLHISDLGIRNFSSEPDFLIVFPHICDRFFFYMFERPDTFGEEMIEVFISKFSAHPIAQLYSLRGNLTDELKLNILAKRKEIKSYVENKYPESGLFHTYFREMLLATKPYE